jgi:hypothetical protein
MGTQTKNMFAWFDELSSKDNSGPMITTVRRRAKKKPSKKIDILPSGNESEGNFIPKVGRP